MFHVATVSGTESAEFVRLVLDDVASSTAMGNLARWRTVGSLRAKPAAQQPREPDDHGGGHREQRERDHARFADDGNGAIDEEGNGSHARKQSDDRAEQEIAPADMRCAR